MKGKWLSMLLTLCVAAGTVMYPAGMDAVSAAEVKSSKAVPVSAAKAGLSDVGETDGYKYRVIADGTVEIVHYTRTDTAPVVPDKIEGKQVTGIGEAAFQSSGLGSITLPVSVKEVAAGAFRSCGSPKEL